MGRFVALIAGLLLATGCRQILGIDDPSVADAPPPQRVTGRVRVRSTHVGTGGVVPEERFYTRAELSIVARLDDESESEVTIGDDGTFSFERASTDQLYRVLVTTPNSALEYQHSAAHLELTDRLAGRGDAVPPTLSTLVKLQVQTPPIGSSSFALSTGIWSATGIIVPSGGNVNLDWNTVGAVPRGLLRADLGDRLYVAGYAVSGGAQPYTYLAQLATISATLTNGVDSVFVVPPPVNLQLGECARVVAHRAAATARVRAAAPLFANAMGSSDFRIFTIPNLAASLLTELPIVFDSSANSDANLDVTFASPFPGQLMIGMGTQLLREVSLEAQTSVTIVAGGVYAETFTPGGGCPMKQLDSTSAIAGNPTIAGVALTTDGSTLVLPAAPVEVSWDVAVTGPVDYYVADVQQITMKGATLVHRLVTVDRHMTVDRALFEAGHLYVISIATVYGQPGASTGDFDTLISPFGIMSIVSPTFRAGT